MRTLKIIVLLSIIPFILTAQKWEGGIFLGGSNYSGDLVRDAIALNETNGAWGALIRKNVTPKLGLRVHLLFGKLTGDDKNYDEPTWRKERGFRFDSRISEIGLVGEWNILGKDRMQEDGSTIRTWSPYLYGGGAFTFSNLKTYYNKSNISTAALATKDENADYPKYSFAVPIGAGVKFDLTNRSILSLEGGYRFTFTDYLDGISLAANPEANDGYGFVGLIYTYFLKEPSLNDPKKDLIAELDTDKDGVKNGEDRCPDVPGLASLKGCPDSDGDGIADKDDKCPDVIGVSSNFGCPDETLKDTDGDGIADKDDKCPNTSGSLNGCPDADGDGIADKDDNCPNANGTVNGCPDADGDGIADKDDKCPNTKGSAKGCPDADGDGVADMDDRCPNSSGGANGCPDSDGDGVPDHLDKCKTTPYNSVTGCPPIEAQDVATLDFALRNIRFETANDRIKSSSYTILDKIQQILVKYPSYNIKISGHTDSIGNSASNMILSEKRANACYRYLLGKGIDSSRMSYSGYGETSPIASNSTKEGRRLNRRVEFVLVGK